MLNQATISVSTTAVILLAKAATGNLVAVTNMGTGVLYIGDWDVSTSNGFEVQGGETYSVDLQPGEALYGIRATGTASALLIYSPPVLASIAVPRRITIGLGSSLPASPAVVVTSTAGLPAAPADGQLALLRVGTWPDTEYVELTYDANAAKWVSPPASLLSMTDQTYMGTNGTTYAYLNLAGGLSGAAGSSTAAQMGWATRGIRHAADLLAAGLKLQAAFSAIAGGSSTPAAYTIMPRFFQHNDGDAVVFSADGSTAVAELGTTIVTSAVTTAKYRATGWVNVVALGTSTPIASSDVSKQNLWPRLYSKVASGTTYGSVIDTDLQYRWTN